jgi:hypothetical protein
MRRALLAAATLLAVSATAGAVRAEPPIHDKVIVKDGTATIAPLAECPAPASTVELTFHLQFHGAFTDETFHVTQTMTGDFVGRDGSGAMVSSGHFVSRHSEQGPGFPVLTITDVIKATGTTVDGERINIRILFHLTITANDEVSVVFDKIMC